METHHTKLKEMLSDYYKQGYEQGFTDTIYKIKKYANDYVDHDTEILSRVCQVIDDLVKDLFDKYNDYPCIKQVQMPEEIK